MMLFLVKHIEPWVLYKDLLVVPSQHQLKSYYIRTSLIRSQVLYCSPVWRPYLIKDIKKLEQLQHRATKYILSDCISDYKIRLIHLRLLPLMYLFEISDIATSYSLSKTSSTLPTILILTPMFHSLLAILDLVVSS